MTITALLTGRGNSFLKNKNILPVLGKPILWYPCSESKKCNSINHYFVSSDDNKILNLAAKLGFAKIKRPKRLSKKNSLHKDVLLHSLNFLKKNKINTKILVVLLANSVSTKADWIENCISKLKRNKNATAVVPVVLNDDQHPFRAKKIKKNGTLETFFKFKKNISSNRQDLPKSYFLAHNFWVIKTKNIFKNDGQSPWSFMGKKVLPFVIENSVDVHVKADLVKTKNWLKKNRY